MKKIDLMYATFGVDTQCRRCKECPCLVRITPTSKAHYKCTVYGKSRSESTDWTGRWMACGRFGTRQASCADVRRTQRTANVSEVKEKVGAYAPTFFI